MNDDAKKTFFDHFCQDRPTRLGSRLAGKLAESIYQSAQIAGTASVLEIGPGRGVFADVCVSKGIEYWAIEPNEELAKALEKKAVKVLRTIVPPIPPIERRFDAVVMISVMEHMDTMGMALDLAKQVYNLLNPGGRFVIYCPDYLNWKHLFFQSDFSHNYITTRLRLEGLLVSAGFKYIDSCYRNSHFTGIMCFITSAVAARLPFGWLNAVFPKNKVLRKLWKLQMSFLTRVLVVGTK